MKITISTLFLVILAGCAPLAGATKPLNLESSTPIPPTVATPPHSTTVAKTETLESTTTVVPSPTPVSLIIPSLPSDFLKYEVIFNIPGGPYGINYNIDPEWPVGVTVGPMGITKENDGSIWILNGYDNLVLHYDPNGQLLDVVSLKPYQRQMGEAVDLELIDNEIWILGVANSAKVFKFSTSGELLFEYVLSPIRPPIQPYTGLSKTEAGDLVAEKLNGQYRGQIIIKNDNIITPLQPLSFNKNGNTYYLEIGEPRGTPQISGYVWVNDIQIKIDAIKIMGVNRDGSFYLEYQVLNHQINFYILHIDLSGKLIGIAQFPLEERFKPIQNDILIDDEGNIYYLLTQEVGAKLVRLNFFPINVTN